MKKTDSLGRRKFYRIKAPYLVCYRPKFSAGVYGNYNYSLTKDIGCGGIMLISEEKFEHGTEIEMIIRLPMYPDKKVEAKGEVVNIEKTSGRKIVRATRIKFTEFDEEAFRKLDEFINEEMGKSSERVSFERCSGDKKA